MVISNKRSGRRETVRDAAETKNNLIKAAIELFSTRGFRGTSIRDIAKATGMTLSNIYYHFGNKDGLLLEILDTTAKELLNSLSQTAELDSDPLERFNLLLRKHLGLIKCHLKEAKIFFLEEEHLSPEGVALSRKYQTEILDIYRRQLSILRDLGYIHYKKVSVLALNILGVINWNLRWYRSEGPLSLEHLTDEIVAFILCGALGSSRDLSLQRPSTSKRGKTSVKANTKPAKQN